jgi:hypothetical protein
MKSFIIPALLLGSLGLMTAPASAASSTTIDTVTKSQPAQPLIQLAAGRPDRESHARPDRESHARPDRESHAKAMKHKKMKHKMKHKPKMKKMDEEKKS